MDATNETQAKKSEKNISRRERKEREEIVYKTVKETIVVTKEDVDEKWIKYVTDDWIDDATNARKERYYCYRLDTADDRDEWVESYADDPFYNLGRETSEQERSRLYRALSQLSEDQKRLVKYEFFKGYSHKQIAEMEGVSRQAIEQRLETIIKKLRENF